jgi:hypothetical protein
MASGAVQEQGQDHVALDGKTLRGTLGHTASDQHKMHQLTLYDTQSGVLLKEQVTGEKQNELSIVSQFLTPVLVKGRIISADALHTQHACCFSVTRWDRDYVLIAKDNQPTLADDLRLFFSEPPQDCRDWRPARTVDKGHPWTTRNPRTGEQYRTQRVSGQPVGRDCPGVSRDAYRL